MGDIKEQNRLDLNSIIEILDQRIYELRPRASLTYASLASMRGLYAIYSTLALTVIRGCVRFTRRTM